MPSAWERLTGGACNASMPDKRKRAKTAREIKDEYRKRRPAVVAKFSRIAALNSDIDAGGHEAAGALKAKRAMQDSWSRRSSRNVYGFWKPQKD